MGCRLSILQHAMPLRPVLGRPGGTPENYPPSGHPGKMYCGRHRDVIPDDIPQGPVRAREALRGRFGQFFGAVRGAEISIGCHTLVVIPGCHTLVVIPIFMRAAYGRRRPPRSAHGHIYIYIYICERTRYLCIRLEKDSERYPLY